MPRLKGSSKKQALVAIVAAGLIGFGVFGLVQRYRATNNPHPTIPAGPVTYSTASPDETAPGQACSTYEVPAAEPRRVELPRLGIDGCIQKVGIDQNNQIAVPTNIHLAGWFVGSPLPGKEGVSIIDGHVLGRYNQAIFAQLKQSVPGDKIRVEFGDKTWREFEVVSVNSYSVEQTSSELYRQLGNVKNQLNLITCTGSFDKSSETYNQRVIVRAKSL